MIFNFWYLQRVGIGHACVPLNTTHNAVSRLQVFFVEDKSMPGWSVVLKKESRSRRINSTEEDHGLGQEGSEDDLRVFANMESTGMGPAEQNAGDEADGRRSNGRRRNRDETR